MGVVWFDAACLVLRWCKPLGEKFPVTQHPHDDSTVLDELRRRYLLGESLRQLANAFGMSHESVRRRLLRAGVTLRPRGEPRAYALGEETYPELRRAYESGMTIAQMAVRWEVSRDAMRSALQRAGVTLRKPGRRRSVEPDEIYGRLKVVAYLRERGRWECVCSCGKTAFVTSNALTTGRQVSCGCYNRERRAKTSQSFADE